MRIKSNTTFKYFDFPNEDWENIEPNTIYDIGYLEYHQEMNSISDENIFKTLIVGGYYIVYSFGLRGVIDEQDWDKHITILKKESNILDVTGCTFEAVKI
jgi:hypothetical protein